MNLRLLAASMLFAHAAAAQPVDPYAPAAPAAPTAPAPTAPIDPYATPSKKPAKKPIAKKPAKKPKVPKAPAPLDPYAEPVPVAAPATDVASTAGAAPAAGATPAATPTPPPDPANARFDLAAVQGLLAVQNLDGWLLVDLAGQNPIARSLVAVQGTPSRRWFYLVPRTGEPTILCHTSEAASFATAVAGHRITYTGYRDLAQALKVLLKGKRTLAMEYSPRGELPSLSRVDAGTIELIRAAGVTVKPSEGLVQFAKATWGPEGRKKHYIAVHHLTELRKDALAFIARQLAAGLPVTERDVQTRLAQGLTTRGLIGPPPVVAFGKNTADPDYVPGPTRAATLARGEVVVISLAGKLDGGVFAATTWVAVADASVPPVLAKAFETTSLARDEALALVSDRVKRRRAVRGFEVDKAARDFLTRAGAIGRVLHRTGHSLDADLDGSGTDLDDFEVKDRRNLVAGTGFTIGPGLYYAGEFGVRAEVSVYLGRDGLEVTTPVQDQVELLVRP